MNIGDNIKSFRLKSGYTQKDLAEKLNVSYQTVSKWENCTNEPDIQTLKKLCSIFSCTMNELTDFNDNTQANIIEDVDVITDTNLVVCKGCGKTLSSEDNIHMEVSSNGEEVVLCDQCYDRNEKYKELINDSSSLVDTPNDDTDYVSNSKRKKLLIWSIVGGSLALAITLTLCIIFVKYVGIALTIILPIIVGYAIFADIYCLFTKDSQVNEIFIDIASWSIKFPGVIFSFDIDGIEFLIAMKLLFFVLGILFAVGVFLFAILITSIISIFAFPFVYKKY